MVTIEDEPGDVIRRLPARKHRHYQLGRIQGSPHVDVVEREVQVVVEGPVHPPAVQLEDPFRRFLHAVPPPLPTAACVWPRLFCFQPEMLYDHTYGMRRGEWSR